MMRNMCDKYAKKLKKKTKQNKERKIQMFSEANQYTCRAVGIQCNRSHLGCGVWAINRKNNDGKCSLSLPVSA